MKFSTSPKRKIIQKKSEERFNIAIIVVCLDIKQTNNEQRNKTLIFLSVLITRMVFSLSMM